MKVSYNWLKEYIDLALIPEEVADRLTMSGIEVEGLEKSSQDTIMELNVTTNRPDCLSLLGVARELSVLLEVSLRPLLIQFEELAEEITNLAKVTIEEPELCPRYSARIVKNVKIGPSPSWLQQKLEGAGIRTINNLVDVTNYVMLELGQPLHAFDLDLLKGGQIIVRRARRGERIVTLDGIERYLSEEMLVIADAEKPVAIAGIMGGSNSEVKVGTKNVLIESANFNPKSVRRTAKKLGITTEASYRFERGVDPQGTVLALNRAAQLMAEVSGGGIIKGVIDEYPRPCLPQEIVLAPSWVNAILGTSIPSEEMARILSRLGFKLNKKGEDFLVGVPTFRLDVLQAIDLVEEIARIYGYDKIEVSLPRIEGVLEGEERSWVVERRVKAILNSCGLTEIITYSFISSSVFDKMRLPQSDRRRQTIKLRNPLSEAQSVMRTTLLPGILSVLSWNANRDINNVKIFELGCVFLPSEGKPLPEERRYLSGAIMGLRKEGFWDEKEVEVDFYDLKGIVENLLNELGVTDFKLEKESDPTFHPGRCARLKVGEEELGIIGELHEEVAREYNLTKRVYLFEFDFEKIIAQASLQKSYQPLSRYPGVRRDLAVIVAEEVPSERLVEIIKKVGGDLIHSVRLFDLYRGRQIPEGYKSLAFSIFYQAKDRTLTDEEVNKFHSQIGMELEREVGAQHRT